MNRGDHRRCRRGDSAQAAQQIQRDPLPCQNAPRRARQSRDHVARSDNRAIIVLDTHLDRGIDEFEGEPRQIEPGNDSLLAGDNKSRGLVANRHDRISREIARAAEILKQGHANQRFDQDAGEGRERHRVPAN